MKKFVVDKKVFEALPGYCLGVLVAKGIENDRKNEKIESMLKKEIEKFSKNSKIKFEKIQIENDINDILLFENLYYIAKKYNTSYISTGHKITISSSIMTFISKNNLTFISPF